MNRAFRTAAFVSLLVLVAAACGSRVVPLEQVGLGQNGQPIANPTAAGSLAPSLGPSGAPTAGVADPGLGSLPGANPDCRGGATDKGVTASEIKVGLVAAKTGSFPGQFDPNIEAVDAYFKMINAAGGICHRQLKLFIRDDGGNRSNDETRALELAKEVGVFAFVGSISAPDSDGGVSKVAKDFKMPDIGFPLSYERSESSAHVRGPRPAPAQTDRRRRERLGIPEPAQRHQAGRDLVGRRVTRVQGERVGVRSRDAEVE